MEDYNGIELRGLMLKVTSKNSDISDVIESMRSLRNLVGKSPELYQNEVLVEDTAIFATSHMIIDIYNNNEYDKVGLSELCIMWQLIHNLCVGQTLFCQKLWVQLEEPLLKLLESHDDAKLKNVLSAVLLQVIKHDDIFASNLTMCKKIVKVLLESIVNDTKELLQFPLLVIQEFLRNQTEFSLESTYADLDHRQRLALLDILAEEKTESLQKRFVEFLVDSFKTQATILMTVLKRDEIADPSEVSRVLSILGIFSHATGCMPLLQSDKSLLIDAVYLLRMVHDVGKTNPNHLFSTVKNMNEIANQEKMESDPVFGFKRDLIRLIGNLCHEHKENQDQVREINGIELLLDCSPIDGKNPYISQWVIFSIRNVCLRNPENQAILNSVSKNGKMDKKVLEEVGIQIQNM